MRKRIVAAVLIGAFVTPALALTAETYFVGFDPTEMIAARGCL